jgi:hypothetical protein
LIRLIGRLMRSLSGTSSQEQHAERERQQLTALIEWVEKQALDNLRFRIQDAENIAKESNTTLTVLLAALGGGIAYCAKLLEADADQEVVAGVVVALAYVAGLCGVLVVKCMKIMAMPVPTNEPRNLLQKGFSLNAVREVELQNVQARIDEAVARNDVTSAWLNRVRLLAVFTPLVFAIGMALAEL